MSLLTRRIFFECLKVFFISVAVLMTFVLMGRALQLKDMLLGLELNFLDTVLVFTFLSPSFLLLMTPISAMIAVFLTFLRMGSDREFIAVKAGGISLYQLLPAPIIFGIICSLLTLLISYSGISWGSANFRSLLIEIAQTRMSLALQPGTFNQDIPNTTFYAKQIDTKKGTLSQVLIEDKSRKDATLTILSPKGNLDIDYEQGDIFLLLQDGIIYTKQDTNITTLNFKEYVMRFSLSSIVQGLNLGTIKTREMHFSTLLNYNIAEEMLEDKNFALKIISERHKRVIFPISCIVLTVFAVAIAASCQGIHRQIGLVLTLIIFFIYYSLVSFGLNLVEFGKNPYFTVWLPVFIFFSIACYGINSAARERIPSIFEVFYRLRKIFKKHKLPR